MVPWRHPSALLGHLLHILVNLRRRLHNLIHRSLIPRPGPLNIAQRLLQPTQLHAHLIPRLLRILNRDPLELLNRSQLFLDVVGGRLEVLEVGLDLVDHGLVLQLRAVRREIDGLRRVLQLLDFAAGIVVAFLEGG